MNTKEVGEKLELNFTVETHNQKMNGNLQNSVALASFSKWPSAKTLTNTAKKNDEKCFKKSL